MVRYTRLGYRPRAAIGELPDLLVAEQYRKCVAFLYGDADDPNMPGTIRRTPVGTAFFVGITLEDVNYTVTYVVTARHVIEMSRAAGLDPLYVRVNLKTGGFRDLPAPFDAWTAHPLTDVAVSPMAWGADFDILNIRIDQMLTDEAIEERAVRPGEDIKDWRFPVGLGDDVFFVGLFSQHPGREHNRPVLRFGNIARMPEEPIRVETDLGGGSMLVDAYLVEARSRGGHSGSPAFLFHPSHHGIVLVSVKPPGPRLLGLVQGHFEAPSDFALLGDVGAMPENAGMAVVIPAQKVLETLMMDELKEHREELRKDAAKREPIATADAARTQDADPPLTRQDFMRDLKKAARRSEQDPSSRSGRGKPRLSPDQ